MSKALVVGAGRSRSRLIDQGLEGTTLHVVRSRWLTYLHSRSRANPSLVIYDLSGENAPKADVLLRLPDSMPETGVLYLAGSDGGELEELSAALQRPNVDFILDTNDPRELRLRATRLIARSVGYPNAIKGSESVSTSAPSRVLHHIVPRLHTSNGRLDAREVCSLYGISLAALARSLGRSEQSVHKTPTSLAIQSGLRIYERVAALLLRLTGSETGLRAWMQASNPELENEPPIALLLNGEGEVVEGMLESVLHGEPS